MRFQMFCMRDAKSGVYLQPFVARSDVDAKRQLASGFEDPGFLSTPAGRYPQEFDLYRVGTFDDESGIVEVEVKPVHCANLASLRPLPPASTVSS